MRILVKKANSNLILYHATALYKVPSIMTQGLVPGATAPAGQDWSGKYTGVGIYFHSTFPQHELDQNKGLFDFNDINDIESSVVVFEVHLPFNNESNKDLEKLVPDEEVYGWKYEPTINDGFKAYTNGDSIVWLDKIDSASIKYVYYENDNRIKKYIEDNLSQYNKLFLTK